jgi:phage baseplate assembly protein gpV
MKKIHDTILHPLLILLVLLLVTAPFSAAAPGGPTPAAVPIVNCDHPVNPNAHFSVEHSESATIAQTVVFTDESTAPGSQPITTWRWDFGDGTTSDKKSPRHTYTTYPAGESIWVNLRVTTACGRSDEYNAIFGLHCMPPVASFTTDVTGGAAPLTVHVTDTSVNAPESATTWKYTIWQDHTEIAQLNQRTRSTRSARRESTGSTRTSPSLLCTQRLGAGYRSPRTRSSDNRGHDHHRGGNGNRGVTDSNSG